MIYLNDKNSTQKYALYLDNKSTNISNCKFQIGFNHFCNAYKYNIISLWIYHGKNATTNKLLRNSVKTQGTNKNVTPNDNFVNTIIF